MTTAPDVDSALGRRSTDALLGCCVSWHNECRGVRRAYQEWAVSDRRPGAALLYAGCVAAVEAKRKPRAYAVQDRSLDPDVHDDTQIKTAWLSAVSTPAHAQQRRSVLADALRDGLIP